MGKKLKSDSHLQYLLLIKQKIDEQENKIKTHFILQTVREFSYFQYDLSVTNKMEKQNVIFKIEGLHAPKITIPKTGPAKYEIEYEIPDGIYTITIIHYKKENNFLIELTNNKVVIKNSPQKKFADIITDNLAKEYVP